MKVKFLPSGQEFELAKGQSVLDLAFKNGVYIKSVCRGVASCAECRVRVVEGEHNVLPPLPKELTLIGSAQFVDQSRLACQMKCFGDVVVDLTEQEEKKKKSSLKRPRGPAVQVAERTVARSDIAALDEKFELVAPEATSPSREQNNTHKQGDKHGRSGQSRRRSRRPKPKN